MDDHLSKPFTRESLQAMLAKWLEPRDGARVPPAAPPAPAAQTGTPSVPATPADQSPDLLDLKILKDLNGIGQALGRDLLKKAIDLYLTDMPPRVAQLRQALVEGDPLSIASLAHALKSSSAQIGAARLASLAAEIEDRARTGLDLTQPGLSARLAADQQDTAAALARLADSGARSLELGA